MVVKRKRAPRRWASGYNNLLKAGYGIARKMRRLSKSTGLPLYDRRLSNPMANGKSVSTTRATTKRRPYKSYAAYATTGFGPYKFQRKKRVRAYPKWDVMGATFKKQVGGTVTASSSGQNVVYCGHATNANEVVHKGVWRSIFKKFMNKAGYDITSFEQEFISVASSFTIFYYYRSNADSQLEQTVTYAFPATASTYAQLFDNFYDALRTAYGTAPEAKVPIRMILQDSSSQETHCMMDLKGTYVKFMLTSALIMQNRTLSGGAAAAEQVNNVENNPLRGRMYCTNGNGFKPIWRDPTDATWTALIGKVSDGVMLGNQEKTLPKKSRIPEPSFFRRTTAGAKVLLQPGQIKKDILVTHHSMGMEKFEEIYQDTISNSQQGTPTQTVYCPLGKATLFAFEKVCDTRAADESLISLGYEHNLIVRSICYQKRPPTSSLEDSSNTAQDFS